MKRSLAIFLFLLCAAAFVFGLLQLFRMRFEAGDIYPPYSSLRADPLGTMALYESLGQMPGIAARRDYSVENKLPAEHNTTYLHIAAPAYRVRRLPAALVEEIERFAHRGGRLVIALYPAPADEFRFGQWEEPETNAIPRRKQEQNKQDEKKVEEDLEEEDDQIPARPQPKKRKPATRSRSVQTVTLAREWGIGFSIENLKQGEDNYEAVEVRLAADLPLPETVSWHSGIVLTNSNAEWKPIYLRGTNAVVVERRIGQGSIVIATDSYFFSNEALQRDRHADLLAWVIGKGRNVVFDEAHLGVTEQPGMATLLRKYRLYWLVGALVLLGILFIWKNALSLAPPHPDERTRGFVLGKDAAAGFVNLLRRSIPPQELLASCFKEWKRTAVGGTHFSAARRAAAEALFQTEQALPANKRNPVRAYREIHHTLESKRPAAAAQKPIDSRTKETTT